MAVQKTPHAAHIGPHFGISFENYFDEVRTFFSRCDLGTTQKPGYFREDRPFLLRGCGSKPAFSQLKIGEKIDIFFLIREKGGSTSL